MPALLFVLFVFASAGAAVYVDSPAVAVYALSFWHYYVYWLAYLFGASSLAAFKRDAILMKSASILILGWVYLSASPDILSVCVVASGFALNAYAALVLGSDRTYYGYEIGALPLRRITSFPYSITAHPMLIGNIIGFGGALIDADFRAHWWPLAIAHGALNISLLIMEMTISAGSGRARTAQSSSVAGRFFIGLIGLSVSAAIGYAAPEPLGPTIGALLGAVIFLHAFALYDRYCLGAGARFENHSSGNRSVT